MPSKVSFGHPKWQPAAILYKNLKNKIMVLIWNGKKWFLDIQNDYRHPKHLQKKLSEWFEQFSNRLLAEYNLI